MYQTSANIARNSVNLGARNTGAEVTRQFRGDKRANFRGDSGKPLAFGLSQGQWQDASSAAMRAHVGNDRHAAKRLSNILECSPRTAENFLLGRTAPSGIHLLRAMAIIPEFAAEVRRLTGMEAALDPMFGRDLVDFMTKATRYLDQHGNQEEDPERTD